MKRILDLRFRIGARALAVVVASHALFVGCSSSEEDEGGPRGPGATYAERNGTPTMTLSDGTFIVLDRLDDWAELRERFPAPPETAPEEEETPTLLPKERIAPKARPAQVDLRDGQTPIRDQAGRGTCVAHATIAALEAAYLRERRLMLDLSEQYANHVQKMAWLTEVPVTPAERETQLGAWGGSFLGYQLGWLFRLKFGLPLESVMAGIVVAGIESDDSNLTYIPWWAYENTNQDGDIPRMTWSDTTLSQRTVDAWNLSPEPMAYSIPESVTLISFPRAAPAEALYGVTRVRRVESSLDEIRDELAAGREVAFGVALTRVQPCVDEEDNDLPDGDPCYDVQDSQEIAQYADGIWHPLTTEWGGHAMLIVGYDDAREAFIVKNSWGVDEMGNGKPVGAAAGTSGFIYMSYDWMPKIADTYSVLETRDPSAWPNVQPNLGKWHVETDLPLERADLAAYHLPGAFPSSSLSGQTDRRIGTLYDGDGAYRVNGSLRAGRMQAYFDTTGTYARYDALVPSSGGTAIVALRIDDDTLAGSTHPPGDHDMREPFFATLGDYPAMQFARETAGNPAPLDFFGSWRIVGAGLDGVLVFADSITDGTYTSDSGSAITGVELQINPRTFISDPDDPCFVRITVPTDPSLTLDGLLFCSTSTSALRALITGIGDQTGVGDASGFYAYRERLDPAVIIQSPADGSVVPRGRQSVEFRARTLGFTEAPVVRWTSNRDGVIGESAGSFSRVDLSFGSHVITASTTAPGGGTLNDSVQLTISNDPPTVNIVQPTGVEPYCANESIEFLATSQDLNNTPTFDLPESAIEWSVAGGASLGIGHAVTSSFPEGGYTVVVRATDDQGAFAEGSVNLLVETCADNPPTASIVQPAVDSGTSDNEYAFDGYDNGRAQWYTDVTFVGTGTDPEDGSLSGSALVWTTNRTDLQSGTLGTGGTVTARLYADVCSGAWHDVRLTVTDGDGNQRSAVRRIHIWTLC